MKVVREASRAGACIIEEALGLPFWKRNVRRRDVWDSWRKYDIYEDSESTECWLRNADDVD